MHDIATVTKLWKCSPSTGGAGAEDSTPPFRPSCYTFSLSCFLSGLSNGVTFVSSVSSDPTESLSVINACPVSYDREQKHPADHVAGIARRISGLRPWLWSSSCDQLPFYTADFHYCIFAQATVQSRYHYTCTGRRRYAASRRSARKKQNARHGEIIYSKRFRPSSIVDTELHIFAPVDQN